MAEVTSPNHPGSGPRGADPAPTDGTAAIRLVPADGEDDTGEQLADLFDRSAYGGESFDEVTDLDTPTDGRTQRRTRNREAVIGALLELMREGHLEPHVAAIADRAGVSHRSVFRYFDDLSDLVRAAIDREVRDALPLAVLPDIGQGPLERRVESFVDARLRIYERTYQVGRIARLRAATIPALEDGLRSISTLLGSQLRNHFRTELADLDQADADALVDVVLVQVSFESYDLHLRMYGHDPERIREIWHLALLRLLGG